MTITTEQFVTLLFFLLLVGGLCYHIGWCDCAHEMRGRQPAGDDSGDVPGAHQ